jgi:thiol-disulfide isomerase/thioredoxin
VTRMKFTAIAFMLLAAVSCLPTCQAEAILLEFSSAHCPPCQAMKPVLSQLERSGVPIRHVDVVAEPHLASRYGVRKTPTFIVVNDGKEVTRLVGMQTAEKLSEALATSPSGPLIATRSSSVDLAAPQTRLAPISIPARTQPQEQAESMPSLSVADAVQRAQAATVRLRVYDGHGHGAGTGTIIDTHDGEALVLTCGHLFRDTQGKGKIEVDLFVGGQVRTVAGQVLDFDPDTRDIALVIIRPEVAVQPVRVISDSQRVSNGTVAFSFGCDRGDDPTRRDTRITGVNKYNQHLGVSNLEIDGAPIEGRSGGGLFDEQGRLIGVCNAADYKSDIGIYAGPGSVHWQLDRVNLSQLYKRPDSPVDRPLAVSPPTDRIASIDHSVAAAVTQPAPAPSPSARPAAMSRQANQEVIVIVRERGKPATSKVMTLQEPTADLMQMIERQSR